MTAQVTPITHNNDRIERLQQVMTALLKSSPVNLHSTIVVIAPRSVQRRWMHAEAVLQTKRHFVYIDSDVGLGKLVEAVDEQVVFVVDEVHPDQRPKMLEHLKKLNMDAHGHRMFLTSLAPVQNPDAASTLKLING